MSCADCFKGFAMEGETVGTMSINGAYFTPAPSGSSKRAVFLLTDIFGMALNNPKVMADFFARELDCDVWVPDLFNGSPPLKFTDMKIPEKAGDKMSYLTMLGLVWTLLFRFSGLYRNRAAVTDVRLKEFHDKVQAEKGYASISATGYCYGGAMAIRMASTDLFKSVAVYHPASFTFEQVNAIKIPTTWGFAEEDIELTHEKRLQVEVELRAKIDKEPSLEAEFIDYKGCTHGYASRPNMKYPLVKEGFEKSLMQTVNFFNKTMPV